MENNVWVLGVLREIREISGEEGLERTAAMLNEAIAIARFEIDKPKPPTKNKQFVIVNGFPTNRR
ncbi:MAG: hypothetical protein ABJL67_00295 [Sulfitobacter sp.]